MTFLVIWPKNDGTVVNYLASGKRDKVGHVVGLARLCDHDHGTRRSACECPDALAKVPPGTNLEQFLES